MTTATQLRVHVRWMIRRDLPGVLAVEEGTPGPTWDEGMFVRTLKVRNCIGMVAEQGEQLLGFMVYELHEKRLHLLRLGVHPAYRRQGVGRQLVVKLVGKLGRHCGFRRNRITVDVRERNLAAQLFLRSQGFQATDVRREAYGDEDAYLFSFELEGD